MCFPLRILSAYLVKPIDRTSRRCPFEPGSIPSRSSHGVRSGAICDRGFSDPDPFGARNGPQIPNWFATELLTFLPTHHKLHQAPFCLTMSTPTFLPHYRCNPSACPMQSPFSATTVVSGNMLSKLSSQWAKQSDSRSITVSRPIPPLYPVEWRR